MTNKYPATLVQTFGSTCTKFQRGSESPEKMADSVWHRSGLAGQQRRRRPSTAAAAAAADAAKSSSSPVAVLGQHLVGQESE